MRQIPGVRQKPGPKRQILECTPLEMTWDMSHVIFFFFGGGGRTVNNIWLDAMVTSMTCCFLAGVLCPAAAGSCTGWFWGEAGSAALAFPFSVSFFSWGCLASVSVPDSVVMVNHAEEGKE